MQVALKAATNVGKVREVNEDSVCVVDSTNSVFICDGMGGHAAGATASKVAVETIEYINSLRNNEFPSKFNSTAKELLLKYLHDLNQDSDALIPDEALNLINAVQMANLRIYNMSQHQVELRGMGTTVVGLTFCRNLACAIHVGDSRIYRIRGQKIEQLTEDHSWVNELIQAGKLKLSEAENFRHRHVITRALGVDEQVRPDIRIDPIQQNDMFLLSSDGLHDLLSQEEILNIIETSKDDYALCLEQLIKRANDLGGKDNITVVLAKVLELEPFSNVFYHQETIPEENEKQLALENKILALLF